MGANRGSKGWSTTDIALAAYVNMRGTDDGVKLVKVERNGSGSSYVYLDPNGAIDAYLVDFSSSESFKFDSQVRMLKSLAFSRDIRR